MPALEAGAMLALGTWVDAGKTNLDAIAFMPLPLPCSLMSQEDERGSHCTQFLQMPARSLYFHTLSRVYKENHLLHRHNYGLHTNLTWTLHRCLGDQALRDFRAVDPCRIRTSSMAHHQRAVVVRCEAYDQDQGKGCHLFRPNPRQNHPEYIVAILVFV